MTLKEYVDKCSQAGRVDGQAVAAVRLGVGYHTLYAWLRGSRKPGRMARQRLARRSIVF